MHDREELILITRDINRGRIGMAHSRALIGNLIAPYGGGSATVDQLLQLSEQDLVTLAVRHMRVGTLPGFPVRIETAHLSLIEPLLHQWLDGYRDVRNLEAAHRSIVAGLARSRSPGPPGMGEAPCHISDTKNMPFAHRIGLPSAPDLPPALPPPPQLGSVGDGARTPECKHTQRRRQNDRDR